MICLCCQKTIEPGRKVVVIPFPAAGAQRVLIAHATCCPKAVGYKGNEVGIFVLGSALFFVPWEAIAGFERAAGGGVEDG